MQLAALHVTFNKPNFLTLQKSGLNSKCETINETNVAQNFV